MTIDLTGRELFVIVNALNYAKNEWAMFDGDMIDRDGSLAHAPNRTIRSRPGDSQ